MVFRECREINILVPGEFIYENNNLNVFLNSVSNQTDVACFTSNQFLKLAFVFLYIMIITNRLL